MRNDTVALVIIFNHRYDKNIKVLKNLYSQRFSNIFFLVPFYDGNEENVIPVYENSFFFQGYIAQAFDKFFRDTFSHYFFIGDDLILNPAINETNYQQFFGITEDSSFLPFLENMPGGNWPHNRYGLIYNPNRDGVEIKNEIPSAEEAEKIISALGVTNSSFNFQQVYFPKGYINLKNIIFQLIVFLYDTVVLKARLKSSKYPFVRSYSDIFIISSVNIQKFIKLCGVFAASDLWVELAIPTALVLSGEKVQTEVRLPLKGKQLWSKEDLNTLNKYNYELEVLLKNFPNYLYIHPVKLSKWKTGS